MLKRSIKARLTAVFLLMALVISAAVGVHAFLMTNELLHRKANAIMTARCEAEAAHIDDHLDDIQRNVRLMSWYCLDRLDDPYALTDPEYLAEYEANMLDMFIAIAENTSGAVSFYLRFDPALTTSTAGFFYCRAADGDVFEPAEPTDLALYAPEDAGRVGWYWQPVQAGTPLWLEPYENLNTGVTMISYVVPLYQDGILIGVVGMDIDCAYLMQETHAISLYENGYAYLSNAEGVPYHDHFASIDHRQCIEAQSPLLNGMRLSLHASYLNVIRESYPILYRSAAIFLVLMVICTLIMLHMINRVISPLRELTQAVRQIEAGQEGVEIPGGDRQDEIGVLAQAFSQMSDALHSRITSMNELAFRDPLTGVKSRAAYVDAAARMDQLVAEDPSPFGLILADSNDLKRINDSHGHDVGDAYISHVCRIICTVFKHSPVYRVGGDEFIVLLEGHDLDQREALLAQLDHDFAASPFTLADGETLPCRIALGLALFDPAQDKGVNDVFNRADQLMYQQKRRMKGQAN